MSYTRNTTTGAPRLLDNNKYYAFGMNHLNQTAGSLFHPLSVPYNYKHSGKELQETGMYDFGWRHYMPDIGRWNGMDQLSEMYAPISPYAYVANNPVSFIDPDGKKIVEGADGWTFTGADINLLLGYLGAGGDFGNLTTQLGGFGEDFGGGPVSTFWDTFNSNSGFSSFQRNGWVHWSTTSGGFNGIGNLNTSNHYAKKLYPSSSEVTPWQVGWEWLSGEGPRHRDFTNGDYFTEMLRQHSHIEETRNSIIADIGLGKKGLAPYKLKGIQGVGKYIKDYSTLLTAGQTGNIAVTYLGSYDLKWEVCGINDVSAYVLFNVENSSTMQSASRPPVLGYLTIWQDTVGKSINNAFSTGWGSETTQSFNWTETIYFK